LRRPIFRTDGGYVEPCDGAGLGLDIDEELLAQWQVAP
jgi:hypothetical protein